MQKNLSFRSGNMIKGISILFACGLLTLWVLAKTGDLNNARTKYPTLPGTKLDSCLLCHNTAGGSGMNPYGTAYGSAGRSTAGLTAIEGRDSDGDGATNLQEIQAGTFPGNAADKPAPAMTVSLEFAQLAAGGIWRSYLVLNNNASSEISGKADFLGTGGQPLTLEVDGTAKSSHSFAIPAGGFLKLALYHSALEQRGWCKVSATDAIGGMLVYQELSGPSAVSQATVLPSARMKRFRMSMPQLGSATEVGLALANLSANPAQITIGYYTPDGKTPGVLSSLTLPPGGQAAKLIWEYIPSFPPLQEGVLEVSSSQDLAAVGLLFINNWTVFTAVPIVALP